MSQMIEQAHLMEIQKNLKILPKKNRFTVDEVLNILSGEIKKLIGRGYTVKEIRQLLKQEGLPVSLAKIKIILDPEILPEPPNQPPTATLASIEILDETPAAAGPALQNFLAVPKSNRRTINPKDTPKEL